MGTGTILMIAAASMVFGVMSGATAKGYGRDGATWFIAGAITGPVAFIGLCLFGSARAHPSSAS